MPSSCIDEQFACPVCTAPFSLRLKDFTLKERANLSTSLFGCFRCSSVYFSHTPRASATVQWNLKVLNRNLQWSEKLYKILSASTDVSRVIDVGCGIGTWLHCAQQHGSQVLGFDVASALVDYGIKKFGIPMSSDFFAADHPLVVKEPATLLTCIMVLQHQSDPRALAQSISVYCGKYKAKAFVSVPFFNHDKHSWLLRRDGFKDSIFNDIGAHVTYFSDRGIEIMFNDFGLRVERFLSAGGWRGCLLCSA